MKLHFKPSIIARYSIFVLLTGCAMAPNNTGYGLGSGVGGTMQNAVLSAVMQSVVASILNGQIGSQLSQADQSFRLQQFQGLTQAGAFSQAQQWVNPTTGNKIALAPTGQQIFDQTLKQTCRNLQEVVTLKDGRQLRENRRACQDPNTGKWTLVQ